MDLLTWLIVGLVAGILSSVVAGGIGYGLVGDIVVGIVGSFFGSWIFRQNRYTVPWTPGHDFYRFCRCRRAAVHSASDSTGACGLKS